MNFRRILTSESAFVVLLSFSVSFLAILPQIWAKVVTPPGYFFSGINTIANLQDIQGVYFSAIRNFSKGGFLYQNPLTTSPQEPFFLYPLYMVLGKIVAYSHLPVEWVYHASAFALSFIFLIFIFKFLKIFFADLRARIIAFFLVSFGGLFLFGVPEGIGVFSISIPHFVLAQILLFASLYLLLLISVSKNVRILDWLVLSLSSLVLFSMQPWMAVFILPFSLLWGAFLFFSKKVKWKVFIAPLIFLLTATLPLIYYGNLERAFWASYPMLTPLFMPILLWGILFPLAIIGIIRVLREKMGLPFYFLALWFFVQFALLYSPFSFQRRLSEGLYFPLAVFTIFALEWIVYTFRIQKFATFFSTSATVLLCLGVIAHFLLLFFWLPNDFVYRPIEEKEALLFLDKDGNLEKSVFSLSQTGNFIAGHASVKVFVGHFAQTPNFEIKSQIAKFFYEGKLSLKEREEILAKENICFVYLGPEEKKLVKIDLEKEEYLESLLENRVVAIYKTRWCQI